MGENPAQSLAWEKPPIKSAFENCAATLCDMCAFGERRPDTGLLVRKRTRIVGTAGLVQSVQRLCPGNHEHQPIEGNTKIDGRSMRVSEWAGGYTAQFARAVIRGAQKDLEYNWSHPVEMDVSSRQAEPSDSPRLPEERLEDGEMLRNSGRYAD